MAGELERPSLADDQPAGTVQYLPDVVPAPDQAGICGRAREGEGACGTGACTCTCKSFRDSLRVAAHGEQRLPPGSPRAGAAYLKTEPGQCTTIWPFQRSPEPDKIGRAHV